MGAGLVRLEARVGLSLLLDMLPELHLDLGGPPVFFIGVHGSAMHGPEALHVAHGAAPPDCPLLAAA